MHDLMTPVDRLAEETRFAGVVRVDRNGRPVLEKAYGFSHRGHRVPNTVDGQFGVASGAKGLTALTVMTLIEDGHLALDTPARTVLGTDLGLIGDDVTIEHLLAHRSGIGDYVDEDAQSEITDYVLPVPVHQLATTEQYLSVLDGHPAVAAPGQQFAYNNGGYVVLALIAERVAGVAFADLVDQRVCTPAGMRDTAFLRSDELPARAPIGYLGADGLRTNVLHLPVRGSGDGGIYSTATDIHAMWSALVAGRIVSPDAVAAMMWPRSDVASERMRYGLGFWLHESTDTVMLEGYDAGVSFRTVHAPTGGFTHTVLSNTSNGAWPITRLLDQLLTA